MSKTAISILATLGVALSLYLARALFVPVALAGLLAAVLEPVVRAMRRGRVPVAVGAALSVLGSVAILVIAVSALGPPVRQLVQEELPRALPAAQTRLRQLGVRLPGERSAVRRDTNQTKERTGEQTTSSPTSSPNQATSGGTTPQAPTGLGQAITRAFGVTATALFALMEVLLLTFFLLAAGDAWREKLMRAIGSPQRQRETLEALREVRGVVLRYLVVNLIINAAQGLLVALVVWMLGLPSPLLWGVLTFVAEFVPYFGGAVMVGLLLLTGLATGGGLTHALLAPAAYLLITTLQNNLVSPAAYGRSMRLNPAAILVAVMFWGLVWGIAGVFLAVPLLAAMRIIAERHPTLEPASVFLVD